MPGFAHALATDQLPELKVVEDVLQDFGREVVDALFVVRGRVRGCEHLPYSVRVVAYTAPPAVLVATVFAHFCLFYQSQSVGFGFLGEVAARRVACRVLGYALTASACRVLEHVGEAAKGGKVRLVVKVHHDCWWANGLTDCSTSEMSGV